MQLFVNETLGETWEGYDCPHTLFYMDPPYWQTEGDGVPFEWAQYEAIVLTQHFLHRSGR